MNITRPLKITAIVASLSFVTACTMPTSTVTDPTASSQGASADIPDFWDSSVVHTIAVAYDQDEYDAMIATYLDSGDKEWIAADVTIDGETFEDAGFKLKGNSSLRGTTAEDAENPEDLPWIINLDKFVDGQDLYGAEEFAIRSNTSETALNEAVALDMLDESGLAAEQAVASTFTANGSEESVRLVVENPNTDWMERELGDGYMWKAESGGTWDYVGDDEADYVESFDQEGGDDNYEPLIDFLQFINESDDETFAADLATWLDVDSFATYLAFNEVVDNFDDIEGPGNNGYLYWDIADEQMTIATWDLNLAFGAMNGSGAGGGGFGGPGGEGFGNGEGVPPGDWQASEAPTGDAPTEEAPAGGAPEGFEPLERPEGAMPDGAELPEGFTPGEGMPEGFDPGEDMPEDFEPGEGMPGGQGMRPGGADFAEGGMGGMGGSNILAERFRAIDEYASLIDSEVERLESELIDSGFAEDSLDTWTQLLIDSAADIIDTATIESESADLRERFGA